MSETLLNFGTGVGTLVSTVLRFTPVDSASNASRIESGSGGINVVASGSVLAEVVEQTSEYIDVKFSKGVLGVVEFSSVSEFEVYADGDLTGGVKMINAKVVCTHVGASAVGFGASVVSEEFEQDLSLPADGVITDSPAV